MDTAVAVDFEHVARELGLPADRVRRTVELIDQGNTIPFITRFRRDQTGGLDEEQVRRVYERVVKLRLLAERKQTILKSIESQRQSTPELAEAIQATQSIKRLEDLYLPFKPRKQTLATQARQRGLEPLAQEILDAAPAAADLDARAADFINPDLKLPGLAEVLLGVGHLLAERISEHAELRGQLRKILWKTGRLTATHVEPAEAPAKGAGAAASPAAETALPADEASSDTAAVEPTASEAPASDTPPAATPGEHAAPVASDAPSVPVDSDAPADSDAPVPDAAATVESPGEEAAATEAVESPAAVESSGDTPPTLPTVATRAPSAAAKAEKRKKKKKKKPKTDDSYKDYYNYSEPLSRVPPHRVMAINRGERAKALRVRVECDLEPMLQAAEALLVPADHPHADFLRACTRDALTRLLVPSLEREARRELTEKAETHAVDVFAQNLRKLLLQPPVNGRRVLAIDPGYRSGCKLALVDAFGRVLDHGTIHVVGRDERRQAGRRHLVELVRRHGVSVIAVGNGAASREAEQLVSNVIGDELKDADVAFVIVNEAGASVYSTSPLGREELPGFDPTVRSSISIARRLLDPLSELVKISPAHIGVGMYQHDVKSKQLRDTLDAVVESCVNFVGVDVNTASPALLRYVSGLNQLSARKLYEHRQQHGPFRNRQELYAAPGIGGATFQQAAGFLKIVGGDHPLDRTWIHPESYPIAERVLEKLGASLADLQLKMPAAEPASEPAPEGAIEPAIEPVAEQPAESPATMEPAAAAMPVDAPPAEAATTEAPAAAADETSPPATETAAIDTPPADPPAAEPPAADTSPPEPAPPPAAPPPAAPLPEPPWARAALRQALAEQAAQFEALAERIATLDVEKTADELGVGVLLLQDILSALTRPGRDPRDDLPGPLLRRAILKLEDLQPGMELTGSVLNVVDFGAFVDIGLTDSGLVHISRLADRYVRDPHEVVSVGDVLKVWVVEVDKQRRRVSLTAIRPGSERPAAERGGRSERPPERKSARPPRSRPAASSSTAAAGETAAAPPPPREPRRGKGKKFEPRPSTPRTYVVEAKPKPVKPLSKKVVDGKEPMRSFSDLMQFFEQQSDSDQGPQQK